MRREQRGSRSGRYLRGQPRGRTHHACGPPERRGDAACARARGRLAARALPGAAIRRARSRHRQYRGRHGRRRPFQSRRDGRARCAARGHDGRGGKGLSHARAGRDHRREARGRRRRLARLAAAGDHLVRSRAAQAHDRHRSRRGCAAAAGRGDRVRPLRHGRDGGREPAARSLARSTRRHAHSCRSHAARRRRGGQARAARGRQGRRRTRHRADRARGRKARGRGARARRRIPRRGRRLRLERLCRGAALRRRRRSAAT